MEENTYVADVIDAADNKRACDEACKKVLALTEIASRILKAVVPEYKDCSIDDIMCYIGNIDITHEPVDLDVIPPVISLDNSEDSTMLEGKRFYDIKFTAKAPGKNHDITLIVNIEAQKDYNPGYSLVERGLYYCCRLISSQYGTVFTKSDYNKLQKVYSIWICVDPDEEHRNTIIQYSITPNQIFGELPDKDRQNRDYDLMSLIMVCLNNDINTDNDIIRMLTVLFDLNVEKDEKKAILQNEYGIEMTESLDERVSEMCNVSGMYYEKGMAQGAEKANTQTALKLLALGTVSKEDIAKATGLDLEKINELAKQAVPALV